MRMSENEPCGKSMPVDQPAKHPGHDDRHVFWEEVYAVMKQVQMMWKRKNNSCGRVCSCATLSFCLSLYDGEDQRPYYFHLPEDINFFHDYPDGFPGNWKNGSSSCPSISPVAIDFSFLCATLTHMPRNHPSQRLFLLSFCWAGC